MNDTTLQRHLRDLFDDREVELEPDEDGWLLTDGEFPALRGTWHEPTAEAPGRLDIDIVLDEDRRIEESFAGEGRGETGLRDALGHFERGALPVLLAACWYITDDRTFDIATWELGLRSWDVFMGRWMLRGDGDETVTPPGAAFRAIETALKDEALPPGPHALRLFHVHDADTGAATEVLLDNAPWPAGTRGLEACDWPSRAGSYSAHCLILLDVRDY